MQLNILKALDKVIKFVEEMDYSEETDSLLTLLYDLDTEICEMMNKAEKQLEKVIEIFDGS